mmetsp:Transcript_13653/g.34852  ORF Transcript_13653/g.34852 Transcript_13653/m.34852 type:complete len:216 (-) Transcript_13653:823-1470(-)
MWCGRARVASPQGYVQGQGTTLTAGRRRAGPAQLPPRTCPSRNDQIMHVPRYNDSAMRAPAVTFKAQCPRAMPARSSMPAPKPGGYLRAARTRGLLRLSRVPPPFECSHARLPRLPHPAAALVKAHGCEAQQTRPRDVHRAAHALPLGRVVHGSADPLREELRHGVRTRVGNADAAADGDDRRAGARQEGSVRTRFNRRVDERLEGEHVRAVLLV